MKRIVHLIVIPILLTGFLSGCSWFKSTSAEQKIALASTVAYEAAFVGTAIDLKAHPEHRPAFEASQAVLASLLTSGTGSDLTTALQNLPLNELKGEDGAIIVSGIVTVYSLAKDTFIDVANTPPWFQGVGGAINRGLKDALALAPAKLTRLSTSPTRKTFVLPKR